MREELALTVGTPEQGVQMFEIEGMVQKVVDHLPIRLFWKDRQSVYQGCNLAFAQDVGLESPEQIRGKTDFDLPWAKDQAGDYRADDAEVMDTGIAKTNFEERQTRVNDTDLWLATSKQPIYDEKGVMRGVLGTYQDITEQKRTEEALVKARDEAFQASQIKGEFLATMSHEIRSPLNVILGYLELLQAGGHEHLDLEKTFEAMSSSGQSLRQLIDEVLDLSRLESGKVLLCVKGFDPVAHLRRQFEDLKIQANEKGLDCHLVIDPNLPSTVVADSHRWGQVIRNLLSNAIKFTSEGETRVALTGQALSGGDYELSLTVRDTGIGISEEDQKQLFRKFSRVDNSHGRHSGGTGLGLYLSKMLCQLMKGDISLKSAQGQGAEFRAHIQVPLPSSESEVEAGKSMSQNGKDSLASAQKLDILVVDDIPANRKLASLLLKRLGLDSSECSDGFEAVDFLREKGTDLVLLDIEMPGRTGLEVARIVREEEMKQKNSEQPLLLYAMTAGVLPADRRKCFEAGFDGYIPKPVTLASLKEALASLV